MINNTIFKASEIANIVGGRLIGNDTQISYISTDTREEFPKDVCYFALNGENYKGDNFIPTAISKGVSAVVTCSDISCDVPLIYVNNTREALLKLGAYKSKNSKVIAITGSVGKTTVKEMIKSVLSTKYKVISTKENENNEIGVAKTLLSYTDEDYCIVEMGMRKMGEINFMSSIIKPHISVITNCGTAHIGVLGNAENIFFAKTEIIHNTQGFCILPSEKRFKDLDLNTSTPIFIGDNGDYFASNISITKDGIKFYSNTNNNDKFYLPSFSLHNVLNALNAIAVGELCNIEQKSIKQGLSSFSNCQMREEMLVIGEVDIMNDCYNASFESTKSALLSLSNYAKEKNKTPYALIGDMLELGESSQEYHFRIGEYARDAHISDVLVYGTFAKNVCDGFCGGKIFYDYESVAKHIIENLGKNDILLVKASRNMHFEKIINKMKEYVNGI